VVRYHYLLALNQSTNLVEGHTHTGKFNLCAIGPASAAVRRAA